MQHPKFVLITVSLRSPMFKTTHKQIFMTRFLTALYARQSVIVIGFQFLWNQDKPVWGTSMPKGSWPTRVIVIERVEEKSGYIKRNARGM